MNSKTITIGGKEIAIPTTIADRVVNFFNPIKGEERYKSRARMALSGGYTGADKSRRANQRGSRRETDADGAIIPDLVTLREDSQHMARNNPLAVGVLRTNITKVVGTGLKVRPQLDRDVLKISKEQANEWERAAGREFALATDSVEIDIERQLDFAGLQAMAFLKTLEDGDLVVNMPRFARPGSPYKLKLQLIEAARLSTPTDQQQNPRITAGVEKDATTGAPVKLHICNQHPAALYRLGTRPTLVWTALTSFSPAGQPLAILLFDKTRPGQSRGVPYLTPVIELIKQIGRYTDAEVMAAVIGGMQATFVTTETGEAQIGEAVSTDPYDTTGMEMGYGTVIGLTPGAKVESVTPGRPNPAFDPFMQAILRQIGTGLEIPFEVLVKHFTSSYSASRAALMEAWDYFRRRRAWLSSRFCQPVYEAIITEAIVTGRLTAPGFFADPLVRKAWLSTVWIGDAPYHLDPLKEVNAAKGRMEALLTSHEEECAAMPQGGPSWIGKIPQIIEEQRIIKDNRLGGDTATGVAVVEPEEEDP